MEVSDKTIPQKTACSVLYRSRIEIGRILQAFVNEGIAVFANVGHMDDEQLFVSHILSIQPEADSLVLAYGAGKTINSALFKRTALKFKANYQGGRVSFISARPLDTMFEGQPAIQFVFPRVLLHYYREHKRIGIPREIALCCTADNEDTKHLEMRVVDISLDGMGCILCKGGSTLKKGSVLKNCRITLPNGEKIVADLMVRHTNPTTLKNGTIAYRMGVRFIQTPDEIKPLIDQFVRYLDDTKT